MIDVDEPVAGVVIAWMRIPALTLELAKELHEQYTCYTKRNG